MRKKFNPYVILFIILCILAIIPCFAENINEPIIIDGDEVEYSAGAESVIAEGNVVVKFRGTLLNCDKIEVNTKTKDAQAVGNVHLQDERGVLEADNLNYNFQTKRGVLQDAKLRSTPYYFTGKSIKREGEEEYVSTDGHFSTCNYTDPHYRIRAKRVVIFPGDKIVAYSNSLRWLKIPFFYVPVYSHSLKDPFMKVQFKVGKKSTWGPYILSSWRTGINENATLRLYLDRRERLGTAEGFGLNYNAGVLGGGDFKAYYTQERPSRLDEALNQEYQRYLLRLRHMCELDDRTRLALEYYRIKDERMEVDPDAQFLSEYFYREYEKDIQPKSYLSLTHSFSNSNISMLVQKRTNRWYDDGIEKLPEIFYDLPSYRIGQSRFYYKNQTKLSNLTKKYTAPSALDDDVNRVDTYNQITVPGKLAFLDVAPNVGIRETFYSKDINGESFSPRTIFYTGVDVGTRFYRTYDAGNGFFGRGVEKIRHVIIPTIKYAYIHEPTVVPSKLQAFDELDTINGDNRFTLELENKLQTKIDENVVDLVIFRVTSDYIMYSKKDNLSRAQDRFTDFIFDLEFTPFSWLRMEADATYDHRTDYFETANFDSCIILGEGRTIGLGHRYERGENKELTGQLIWQINPKWILGIYERYQFGDFLQQGFKEQEYTVSRDLHCATIEFAYNMRKQNDGTREESFWCRFNIKVFKESEFDYAQAYHVPKQAQ